MNWLSCAIFTSLQVSRAWAALPDYSGPQGVGVIEVEVPAAKPTIIAPGTTMKTTGQPAFRLNTVLFTLYYPAVKDVRSSRAPHPWLSEPSRQIATGLSNAIGGTVPIDLIQLGFNLFAENLTIPAQVDVAIQPGSTKFPVMIFSHGSPTMSAWYSQLYGELASRGVVIAAVEHRDGSSPATSIKFKNGTSYNMTAFTKDLIQPAMSDDDFHAQQLNMRQAEFNEVGNTLTTITGGDGRSVFDANSRGEGQDLSDWANRLDLEKLIIAGQSFGSNAVFRYLREPAPVIAAAAALPFDPGKDSGPLVNGTVKIPLLIADSEEWSGVPKDFYGRPHFDVVKSIAQGSLDSTGAGWFMTLLGTIHTSVTDMGVIAPTFAEFFSNETSRLTLDPKVALMQYVQVARDFVTYVSAKNITGLLATNVTYPNFQVFPNATALSTPWEVHIAPTVPKPKTSFAIRLVPSMSGFRLFALLAVVVSGFVAL